jgi:ATP-dependent RNA helicase DeaD
MADDDSAQHTSGEEEPQGSDSQAPDSQAPDSQAPDSQAPDSQAPGSQAPDSQAPGSQAPDSQAPDSQLSEAQPSESTTESPTFARLGLDERILLAVNQLGFDSPTPIQAESIPPLLAGNDVIGRARTGSGKTAAFGLPLLHRLAEGRSSGRVRALVLAPTRELALQITGALRSYSSELRLHLVTLYGGASYRPQLDALARGVDIVVGTPGRLLDHLRRGSLDLSAVELAVIDEADEMLRMGFIDDVNQLLAAIEQRPQVALFSATMPPPIREIAETYLHEPIEIQVEQKQLTVEHIEQLRVDVPDRRELDTLVRVLGAKKAGATLVFARTRAACDELSKALRARGFTARALHGDMSQAAREEVLEALRNRQLELVVATDVASRGIDVEHLTHVINVDLPDDVEVYVNRIGRTGRAGREGMAISLIKRRDRGLLRRIEAVTKRRMTPMEMPSDAAIGRQARAALEEDLRTAEDHGKASDAAALRDALLETETWDAERLLAASLGLLMRDRRLQIPADASEEPPAWARIRERRPRERDRRDARQRDDRYRRDRPSDDRYRDDRPRDEATFGRAAGPGDGDDRPSHGTLLGAAVGRAHGIAAKDVVGVLTHELGVPFNDIGRIRIGERQLTVAMSPEAARRLDDSPRTVFLRGNRVVFTKARRTKPAPTRVASRPRPERPPRKASKGVAGKGKGKGKAKGKRKGWPSGGDRE